MSRSQTSPPKLAIVVTSSLSTAFFQGQLAFLIQNGFDVSIMSSPGPGLEATRAEGVTACVVPMEREIAPTRDVISLWRLWRQFRRTRPDLVVAGTPKAGLLATVAARLAGVPHVVYMVLGLRLETASGWKRRLLWSAEWVACHAAHHVRSVSPSLRERMSDLSLATLERCRVIGSGALNGVDMEHWRRTPQAESAGRKARERLGIPAEAPVLGFVGRFTRDKGVGELYEAFTRLRSSFPDLRLLLVGDFEEGDPVPSGFRSRIEDDPAVFRTGFVSEVAPYYWAMDVLALPTYREGFPGVLLEAQAASVPVVSTDATGAVDAVLDGVTGLRVPTGDVDSLVAALERLLADAPLRARMGQAGCEWVQKDFQRERVWQSLLAEYHSILQSAPRPRRDPARWLKMLVDRAAAAVLLIVSAPIWLVVAVAIRLSLGSPVFFTQIRPGFQGHPFKLIKFRTMRDMRNRDGVLLIDRYRLTPLGQFLRSLSLDELPQLWNVLRGEMSLVGPRPLLMEYLERYTPEQARRHEVLPGITGWAQVNGRNAIGWEEKFALDVWYVDHWSPLLDLRILGRTLHNVIVQADISNTNHATMPEFLGSRKARILE